jgi:hypothetical protein
VGLDSVGRQDARARRIGVQLPRACSTAMPHHTFHREARRFCTATCADDADQRLLRLRAIAARCALSLQERMFGLMFALLPVPDLLGGVLGEGRSISSWCEYGQYHSYDEQCRHVSEQMTTMSRVDQRLHRHNPAMHQA